MALVIILIVCIVILYRILTTKRRLRREIMNTRWRANNGLTASDRLSNRESLSNLEAEYVKIVGGGFSEAFKYTFKEIGCFLIPIIIIIGILGIIGAIASC